MEKNSKNFFHNFNEYPLPPKFETDPSVPSRSLVVITSVVTVALSLRGSVQFFLKRKIKIK